jgi:hypothetical protein
MHLGGTKRGGKGTILAFASPSFSGALLALLPKCPACLVLLLAPLGIRLPASNLFLAVAVLAALAVPVLMLRSRTCQGCAVWPTSLALVGVGLMAAGRFTSLGSPVILAGSACVCASLFWITRHPKSA